MSQDTDPTPPPLPPDDPDRELTTVQPDDPGLAHIGLVGDTYTVLVTGEQTGGRYTLIDMHVPHGGGPAPHRHDFEEAFTVLEGEVEATFRGQARVVRAGETINVPANAPHSFTNTSQASARLLCVCAPAGQEEFFLQVGVRVEGRTTPPPELTAEQQEQLRDEAQRLAPVYRTELLGP